MSEIFYSIQGEGPSMGRPAWFVRLQGCDVGCWFCDTKYTWRTDVPDAKTFMPEEVVDFLVSKRPSLVILTGGEPMMQRDDVIDMSYRLLDPKLSGLYYSPRIELETSGSYPITDIPDEVNVNCSPKRHKLDMAVLAGLAHRKRTIFKFPVASINDAKHDLFNVSDKVRMARGKVWFMPLGTSHTELMQLGPDLAEFCKETGTNLSWRLHVSLWGAKRGV